LLNFIQSTRVDSKLTRFAMRKPFRLPERNRPRVGNRPDSIY
jgi:hypothetical protein